MSKLERFSEETILENLGVNLKKRTVAIVVAESELSLSQKNLTAIVEAVKGGIVSTQNSAVVLPVATVCDDITAGTTANRYIMPMRGSVANTVECYGSITGIDGFVFVANQPVTITGMLMGALRVNKPCLFISGGYMPTVVVKSKKTGFNESYTFMGQTRTGELSADDLEILKKELISSFACASDSFYANSGNILAEAAGLALQGNATLPANTHQRLLLARATGERIVKMMDSIVTPKMVFTEETLKTALAAELAMGASSTGIINFLALAKCIKSKLNLDAIADFAKKIPCLFHLSSDSQMFMEDFANAGGVYGLLNHLVKSQIITAKHTAYTNQPFETLLKKAQFSAPDANKKSSVKVVYGNLADDGAIAFSSELTSFTGKAKVYDGEEAAFDAIANREISKGDVVVIRGEGPVSGPGMREIRLPVTLLKGLNLDKDVAVITDGRVQNISRGVVVGNICPENCNDKSTLQLLQDGDIINIDLSKGKICVDVPSKELSKRKKLAECNKTETTNYLARYASTVSSASEGALLP